jgi:amino acid adenylation domain-containing protein
VTGSQEDSGRSAAEWNHTAADWPEGDYLKLLERQAESRPDALALSQGHDTYTFSRLWDATDRIAEGLTALGVRPGARVGLCYPRGADYVLGAIGILKTGSAIVALDPVNPDDRLAYMIADAEPDVVLAAPAAAGRIPSETGIHQVADLAAGPAAPSAPSTLSTEQFRPTPDTVSHLIYTSGSTGLPKAVLERSGAIVNLVHWTGRAYGVRPGDRASWLSTPGFAVQIMEWFPYLALGASVHIPEPGQAQTPAQIRDWLVRHRITHTMLVAALAERTWGLDWPVGADLRIMVTTAERVHSWPPADIAFRVVMTYGATETTNVLSCLDLGAGIDFTSQATSAEVRNTRQVPVGRPIANLRVHLLDDDDRPVPLGEVGRLHVAGAGLAAGYHRRPELTAERFRRGVLPSEPGLLYDTGDLGRFRPDGAVELLGREDAQVKVRGFRVELGEVESAVAALASVEQCVVTAREERPGDLRIFAYVTSAAGRIAEPETVRLEAAAWLPAYAVPSVVLVVDDLPRLPNGKVDREALPVPAAADPAETGGYVAPRTEVEEELTRLWTNLFQSPRIGVQDNFFHLGGHSLLAFRLIDAVRESYHVELSLADLAQRPTVAGLAELMAEDRLAGRRDFGGLPPIVPDPDRRFEPFPLTESQEALWIGRGSLVELGEVGCHGYFEWDATDLDLPRFRTAWQRLIERHDALRTMVLPNGTQQVLRDVPDYRIQVRDLSDLDGEALDKELARLREKLAHQVLDAAGWPLFEVGVSRISTGPGELSRIHLSLDFLVADAWSYFQVLVPDLVALYSDPDSPGSPAGITFRDYVLGTREKLRDTDLYRRSTWYWRDRLADLPPAPALPARPEGEPVQPVRFHRRSHRLDSAAWTAVQATARARGVTPSGVLASVYAEVLANWAAQPQFTLNLPLFNRLPLHPDVNLLVGDTTTTLLLAVDWTAATFAERAQALQRQLWADLEHRHFSGIQVLRELTRLRGSLAPAMPVVLTSLAGHPQKRDVSDLGDPVYGISQTPQVSLDFQIFEDADGLDFNWDFLPALFPDGLIDEMFDAACLVLERLQNPRWWDTGGFGLRPDGVRPATAASEPGERRAARRVDSSGAWERYWAAIGKTGHGGDVLWDADDSEELAWVAAQAAARFEPGRPVVDIGCGNGRYSRALAAGFPRVHGIDVSASAIAKAVEESAGLANVGFRVLDMTEPGSAAELVGGPFNVFVRGVLHVLDDDGRTALEQTAETLAGPGGVVIIHEPDYTAGGFGYVGQVGGTRGRAADLIRPLEAAGVRPSAHFTSAERARFFNAERWDVLAEDGSSLRVLAPEREADAAQVPGYFAVLRRRSGGADLP